jgi:type IV pilus assembly protein PilE
VRKLCQEQAARRQAGFTLIEVMLVVVIVAILASVALPAYQDSLQKGRRTDGFSALMDAANRQEQFMLDRSTYTLDMTELGFAADPMVSEEGFYTIDATNAPCGDITLCYTLTATIVAGGPQANDDRCATLSLDSNGSRTATTDQCW